MHISLLFSEYLYLSKSPAYILYILQGAVHEVPGLVPALALDTQENSNGGALTVGTSALVKYSLSKREAEADPALLYSSVAYHPTTLVHAPYTYSYGYPYAYWG